MCFRKGLKATEGCTTDEAEAHARARAPASLTSRLCSALLYAIGSPPSLQSIFIFAVLTFCSFYQRHNEASCSCTGALLHAGKTPRREEALVHGHIPSVQTIYPHKENGHHLWRHKRGRRRGLDLERKRPVNILFVFVPSRSLAAEMDCGVAARSLEDVCSFLLTCVSNRVQRQLSAGH